MTVTFGTVGGVPITGTIGYIGSASLQSVTLTAAYTRTPPPGFATITPAGQSKVGINAMVGTIPSGTTLELLACEATALINAGAATSNGPVNAGKAGG